MGVARKKKVFCGRRRPSDSDGEKGSSGVGKKKKTFFSRSPPFFPIPSSEKAVARPLKKSSLSSLLWRDSPKGIPIRTYLKWKKILYVLRAERHTKTYCSSIF